MATIDYMKVIDLISQLFNAEKVDYSSSHSKFDIFDIVLTLKNNIERKCRLYLDKSYLEIIFNKGYLSEKEFDKWISKFEFQLEQIFLRNIKIETHSESENYRIKITY